MLRAAFRLMTPERLRMRALFTPQLLAPAAAVLLAGAAAILPVSAIAQMRTGGTAAAAQAAASAPAAAASAPLVKEAFAAPMRTAHGLIRESKAAEALPLIAQAAAVPDLTPYETMVLERTRAAAAQKLGDNAMLLKALEAALATGKVEKGDEVGLVESLVSLTADSKDHARVMRWSQRYLELGGTNDAVAVARIQSQLSTGDDRGAMTALSARLDAADREQRTLPESHLRSLLSLQQKVKDPGSARTVERLATAYPRPEYWADLVVAAARDPAMPDRALLPLYRLLRRTGMLVKLDLAEEMAELALRLGYPAETLSILDESAAAASAKPPSSAAQALRTQARRQAATEAADRAAAEAAARRATDGNALTDLGWSLITALPAGAPAAQAGPGLALMEEGLARGGLRRPAEARLQLGIAQLAAGRTEAARQTLAALAAQPPGDGLAPAARLWSRFASAPPMMATRQ